jgi:hypothetical protein
MITKNVWQRMWRTSLMAVAAIAIFWGIWYLIAGSIPQITVLQIDAGWKLALPFAVSQMWNSIIIAAILTPLMVLVYSLMPYEKNVKKSDCYISLIIGLGMGVILAFINIRSLSIYPAATISLVLSMAIYRDVFIVSTFAVFLPVVLCIGLINDSITGLIVGLATVAGISTMAGLKYLFEKKKIILEKACRWIWPANAE